MSEVDKDMSKSDDIASFLRKVAQKGDELRVSPSPKSEVRGRRRSEEEEKRTEEKNDPAVLMDSNTNAAHVNRKHIDFGRAGSALDEKPGQENVSDQCEAFMK